MDFDQNLKLTDHRLPKCHGSPITDAFFVTFLGYALFAWVSSNLK